MSQLHIFGTFMPVIPIWNIYWYEKCGLSMKCSSGDKTQALHVRDYRFNLWFQM